MKITTSTICSMFILQQALFLSSVCMLSQLIHTIVGSTNICFIAMLKQLAQSHPANRCSQVLHSGLNPGSMSLSAMLAKSGQRWEQTLPHSSAPGQFCLGMS